MLTFIGWIDGITASGVVVFGFIFGLFFSYTSKKSGAKLLIYLGLANLFAGLMFLGVFLDFITVLFTGVNIPNPNGLVALLSYIWFAPAIILATYIGAVLILPKIKWVIMGVFILISIIFEILMFMNPLATFNFDYPGVPGELLIDYNVITFSTAGILMAIALLLIIIILGIGFMVKAFQSTGEIKKKFVFISLGALFFCIFGLLEGLTAPGLTIIIIRIGYLASFWFMYYGLKP